MAGVENSTAIDQLDQAIIGALQQDGRRSYASIGRDVGLSEAAVRARVNKLIDSGVMQIAAITDPIRAGMRRQCMIGIRVDGDLDAVADRLAAIPEVDYIVICAGTYDIVAEIVVADDAELFRVLNDRIRSIPAIRETDTLVYLKLVKQTYTWGAI